MAAVVAVTDDPAIRIQVILKRARQARARAHVGGAILLNGIESIGADPDGMRSPIIAITLRQAIPVIDAIHLQSQGKLS